MDIHFDLKGESELGGDSLCYQAIGKLGQSIHYTHLSSKAPSFWMVLIWVGSQVNHTYL